MRAQVILLPLNYFLITQMTDEYLFLYKIKTELRLKCPTSYPNPITSRFRIKETQTDTHTTPNFIHFTSLGV